jgi:hypothetical protein
MLMDIFSAIVVVVPLIAGIALHFNINPYHLGIVFLLNLEIGYLMPPMGLNLFIAGFRFNRPVPDLYKMVLPFIGLFIVALMIITYVPSITLMALPPSRTPVAVVTPTTPTPGTATPAAGDGGGAPQVAPPSDCDVPRDDESFEAFQQRCSGGGAAPAPTAAPAAPSDCDVPRDDESFEAFTRRCNPTPADAAAPPTDAASADDAAPVSADAAAAAPNG